MKWLLILVLVFGISPTVWAVAGLLRLVSLRRRLKAGRTGSQGFASPLTAPARFSRRPPLLDGFARMTLLF